MKRLMGVAWKNVFRNKRRSTLNIIALTVGIWIMILGMGWVEGYHTYLFDAVIDLDTGHLQIVKSGYVEESARFPLDVSVEQYADIRSRVKDIAGVKAVTGRIDFSVQISNGADTIRLMGRAVDPQRERKVTVLADYVEHGEYFGDKGDVLLGTPIAERLDLKSGDGVFLTAVDTEGRRNVVHGTLAGTFAFGYPAMDDNVVFVALDTAAELLAMGDEVSRLVVRLEPGYSPRAEAAELRSRLPEGTAVHSWRRFAQTTVNAVRMDTFSFWVMLVVIFLLVVLGILNSMSMSINERTGEIAALRAIGMRKSAVQRLMLAEATAMCLIAAAVAVFLTAPFAAWLEMGGVDIGSYMPEDLPIPFGERFHADFKAWHYAVALALSAVVAAIGSALPARRASSVNMASALQGKKR